MNLTPEDEIRIARELFPSDQVREKATFQINSEDIPSIEPAEIFEAARRMKPKKAPGIDKLNPELIKTVASKFPDVVAEVFNSVLRAGEIPGMWKTAKLILMEKKSTDSNAPKKYRPLCLLNCLGKLFESVITYRLSKELAEKSPLSKNQYGFIPKRSTIDAIQAIKRKANLNMETHRSNRKFQLLTTIDIKNAFNTASWKWITGELEKKGISTYLRKIIESYLEDRYIILGGGQKLPCTRGVPQGSVLGPTLWNILYDSVLKESLPMGVTVIGYADDTAILSEAKTKEMLQRKTNLALARIIQSIKDRDLEIAPQKTEAVIVYGGRRLKTIEIEIEGDTVRSKESLIYLGVTIERNFRMGAHIKAVTSKGLRVANTLARIMPNTRGPSESKRKLLRSVVLSTVLYASQIWQDALRYQIHRKTLQKSARTACLRVCRGYRTISYEALGVISSMMPIDLLVQLRTRNTKEELEGCLVTWQERWAQTTKGIWTKTLIPEIKPWIQRKHGFLSFELTQFLSGHGKFGSYLKKFKIVDNDDCASCRVTDTVEHTFFHCITFEPERRVLEASLGESFSVQNAVDQMLESQIKWDHIDKYVSGVITQKRQLEGNQSR